MAIKVDNTNYNGEVLEKILTVATTGNELVEKGLIHVIPGVEKKLGVPRIKTGKMLQKRKEDPQVSDAKGDFNYSEQTLEPHDFMAFATFNPRSLEHIWRPFQPKGNLVFAQLPPEVQNKLLDSLSKQVQFELGWHYVNGEYAEGDDDEKLDERHPHPGGESGRLHLRRRLQGHHDEGQAQGHPFKNPHGHA